MKIKLEKAQEKNIRIVKKNYKKNMTITNFHEDRFHVYYSHYYDHLAYIAA